MPRIRIDNHTECPACKNYTLPLSLGGNAITCVNKACLAIIDSVTGKNIGKVEDGVLVYHVNRHKPGVCIKSKELNDIKSYLESLITISKNNKSLIVTIQTLIEEIEKR